MDQAAVLRQLELADSSESPRLGGMARSHGVVIVSQRYWAYAGTDGTPSPDDEPGEAELEPGLQT